MELFVILDSIKIECFTPKKDDTIRPSFTMDDLKRMSRNLRKIIKHVYAIRFQN